MRIMNRIRITVAAACLMAVSILASGQNSRGTENGQQKENQCQKEDWKERMKAEKKTFFEQELMLSEEKAEKFWKAYDKISQKQWQANKAVMDCRRALENACKTEGADYKTLLDNLMEAEDKLSKTNSTAVEELRKRFGDEMTAKLLVAEERFRRNQIHKLNRGKGGPDVHRPQKPRN